MDPLTRLAIRCGTDKWGAHFYTPVYHRLLSHLRAEPIRLLEIGVGGYGWRTVGGESLRMWAEYFPAGRIVAFDIAPKQLAPAPRVTVLQGSQDDPVFLERLCDEHGPFDVVIDDGSHIPQHVVASFEVLFPHLADGGTYVIEDVQTCFWPPFGGTPDGGATMELAATLLRHLHHAELAVFGSAPALPAMARQVRSVRAWHNLLAVEKGDNSEPSNLDAPASDPHVARALAGFEEELARSPTAEGYAQWIGILYRGGALETARELLRHALERWPDSSPLLLVGTDVAASREQRLALLERLARREPEDSQALVEEKRRAIVRGGGGFQAAVAAWKQGRRR
jgi:hypothetical protein